MMERGPESQRVYSMDPDPLQWLWDGVSDFQTKFNDLHTAKFETFIDLLIQPSMMRIVD